MAIIRLNISTAKEIALKKLRDKILGDSTKVVSLTKFIEHILDTVIETTQKDSNA